ncbi:uncharacterized protein LOC110465314 [Mizuhopecten yessoensis]|uniref:Uncharacterized protein n=1 Tax=Mizuhopecten yessoensis TaxID=6573 RepID=A0A210PRX3_MIZYE|nr:uncharacterized protein LOC110465314 [Mizuhopecten yessoensis]XP_021376719.1 uncharacterized protein LOC110465314 [Mizuhopecten yessoensis]OWF39240.1 hypothetical protein KP79_PYT20299 [Mizuhopecten yessoensis]
MTKRAPEWYEEYRKVSDKQRNYLDQIQDLRRTFKSSAKPLMVSIERQRHLRGRKVEPKNPSLRKMEQKVMLFGPQKFPTRQSFLQDKPHKFYMTPTILPRTLPPLVRGKNVDLDGDQIRKDSDLDTIDAVAETNKGVVRGKMSDISDLQKSPSSRKVLSISRVNVKELISPMVRDSPIEYITNVSSRKALMSGPNKEKED